jgi:hypothetical protein
MDHLDELRVATASSLPLNGLAPRTYVVGIGEAVCKTVGSALPATSHPPSHPLQRDA